MTDDARLMRYATAIARDKLDYLCGPEYPLPGQDHDFWKTWKRTAAVVMALADNEHPPPPGSTEERLPDHILNLIVLRPYVSTACQMADSLEWAIIRYAEYKTELQLWRDRMHERCRLNNKFSDVKCGCPCGHPGRGEEDHEVPEG